MKVLGLGGSTHDLSASIAIDGDILCAIEEERITRVKHSINLGLRSFRCRAGDYCMEAAGVSIKDLDLIIGNDILDPNYYYKYKNNIMLINHHLSHAASSYYLSGFDEAACLVVDGYGSQVSEMDHETTTMYHIKGKDFTPIKKSSGLVDKEHDLHLYYNSIGGFYSVVTKALGFGFLQEGKTMGLAAYGCDKYVNEFSEFYNLTNNMDFIFERRDHVAIKQFISNVLSNEMDEEKIFLEKANLAYALQHHCEVVLIQLCNELYRKTKTRNLCIAGGVALNSVANYKILQNTPFSNIFIPPACGDAGTALGSALYGYYNILNQNYTPLKRLFSPYLGKAYTEHEIDTSILKNNELIHAEKPFDLNLEVAKLLSNGNIIGYFHGKSEIGPRALGNRSILADARNPDMKNTINRRIKHREIFRPFAPIILEEKQELYFAMKHPSYYMLFVPPVLEHCRSELPSVTHYDGTGRVQTINKNINPNLHDLLTKFESLTGTPVLLNTSFNDNNEPIVESPDNALSCFLKIDLDYLVLGEYLISKK
ncbi:carbamoyltransferase family protein [Paenibacillus sp. OSY-SE]|uniref:carbamoyltransferase family protein n=1 Tax=Paenibacillus sp. OSY-SE TaxID=1196323 RepID=UPI0002DFF52D|nr:carbamoyltransferase C-terminal domain-containing protein [Paenibacillus sp. OSY-SE]